MARHYFSVLGGLVTLAIIGVAPLSVAQHPVLSPPGICPVAVNEHFRAFQVALGPTCSATTQPTQYLDEFLPFEQWKSIKLSQTPVTMYQSLSAPMETNVLSGSPSISASHPTLSPSPSDTPYMPSLRVPLTDRFNYASQDCSARIPLAHKASKSPASILSSKRDKYMLSPCSAPDKFVVVELCDDIQIDTIQLANFEFFSGVFKDFTVSVAQTYDAEQWNVVGTYRAKNVRGVQSFHPAQDARFYRYVRIDFLSHYGQEYYCPVSLLRVYGLTQMEEYKWDEWQAIWRSEHDTAHAPLALDAVEYVSQGEHHDAIFSTPLLPEAIAVSKEPIISSGLPPAIDTALGSPTTSELTSAPVLTDVPFPSRSAGPNHNPIPREILLVSDKEIQEIVNSIMCHDIDLPDALSTPATAHSPGSPSSEHVSSTPTSSTVPTRIPISTGPSELHAFAESPLPSPDFLYDVPSIPAIATHTMNQPMEPENTLEDPGVSITPMNSTDEAPMSHLIPSPSTTPKPAIIHVPTPSRHTTSSWTSGPGESIYRAIMNRLRALESNSSLSVRYVEDQTRSIRVSLKRLEENIGRLEGISNHQRQALRKTLTELQRHKHEMELERSFLLSQVHNLSHEVTLEKRLGIAQLCLLLVVLIFMTLTRGAPLNTSFLHNFSLSNPDISGANQRGSLWRVRGWTRTKSEPAPPRLPEFIKSPEPSPHSSWPRDTEIKPPSVASPVSIHFSSSARSAFVQNPTIHESLRTPEIASSFASSKSAAGSPHPFSRRNPSPRSEVSLNPGSAQYALAKTAHLHDLSRRRRVNSYTKASYEGPTPNENPPDVFRSSPPLGGARARSWQPSRGAAGVEAERVKRVTRPINAKAKIPSSPVSPTGTWVRQIKSAQLSLPTPLSQEGSHNYLAPSVQGSDAWEDTSELGDDAIDGDRRDDNDDPFAGQESLFLLDPERPSQQRPSQHATSQICEPT